MTMTQHRTDHQIKTYIAEELEWTPNVEADRVGVSISDGAVTLSGQVRTYPEKHAAVNAALRVHGVTAVADEIEVHNEWAPRQDADVAREVAEVLEHTVYAPSDSVKAEVSDHVITLSGHVGWNYQREALAHAVSTLRGVQGVIDSITIKPRLTIEPAEAKAKIAAALRRNAMIDAARIHVGIAGNTITLTGTVSSWAERRQASRTAWATPGVAHVDDQLHVSV